MKQATKIIITDQEGIRLTISLDSSTVKQEGAITEMAIQFYKRISYLINKDYELVSSLYEDESLDIAIEDEVESDDLFDFEEDDQENYLYNDFKYK